jgi:hypothetical protein
MRRILVLFPLLALLASAGAAQPQHGDLVLTASPSNGYQGFTAWLNPKKPGTLTTLRMSPFQNMDNFVRMAPDNADLVVARLSWATNPWSSHLVDVTPGGAATTLARFPIDMIDGYELDHDGQWIVATGQYPANPIQSGLHGVDHGTHAITTYSTLATCISFNELVIDRDPGQSLPYTLVTAYWVTSLCAGPRILKADRKGTIVTMAAGATQGQYFAIEQDPRRDGDYLVCHQPGGVVIRMNKSGQKKTTLTTGFAGNAIKVTQDDFAWVVNGTTGSTFPCGYVLEIDLATDTVVTLFHTGLTQGYYYTGIEVYGSRTLVCNQTSPAAVDVRVQSRHPWVGGSTRYALAASLARRPGLRFPHGEWLDLNTASDPLFFASALNLMPAVFQNFQGSLDLKGNNTAPITVHIPSGLVGSGYTVFVAGILYDQGGVFQVLSTHWFVL